MGWVCLCTSNGLPYTMILMVMYRKTSIRSCIQIVSDYATVNELLTSGTR